MMGAGIILFVIVMGLVSLFSLGSNILFLYSVVTSRKFRTQTYVLICNLSVNDILLAGVVIPQELHDLFHQDDFYEGKYVLFFISESGTILSEIFFFCQKSNRESGSQRLVGYKAERSLSPP